MQQSTASYAVARTGWFKSSYSPSQGSCVETRFDGPAVHIRDSKNPTPQAPMLTFGTQQWARFIGTVAPDAAA